MGGALRPRREGPGLRGAVRRGPSQWKILLLDFITISITLHINIICLSNIDIKITISRLYNFWLSIVIAMSSFLSTPGLHNKISV